MNGLVGSGKKTIFKFRPNGQTYYSGPNQLKAHCFCLTVIQKIQFDKFYINESQKSKVNDLFYKNYFFNCTINTYLCHYILGKISVSGNTRRVGKVRCCFTCVAKTNVRVVQSCPSVLLSETFHCGRYSVISI